MAYIAKAHIHECGKGEVLIDLGESWGYSKEEAQQKMQSKLDEWLHANK
jgi:hypothetical protein